MYFSTLTEVDMNSSCYALKMWNCVFLNGICVNVGEMEWKSGGVQPGGGVSRDALHNQQRRSHLSQRPSGQRDTGPGLYSSKPAYDNCVK